MTKKHNCHSERSEESIFGGSSRTISAIWKLVMLGSVLILCALAAPAVQGDCKCRRPEKGDATRWGGNEAVVLQPEGHFQELKGIVEAFENEPMGDALAEVFDKPDYLISDTPWANRPEQKRIRACVTSTDGKFCFKDLPDGAYELRISHDQGWNVTHVYVVLDHKGGKKKEVHIRMHIGT